MFAEYLEFSKLLNNGLLKECDYGDREIHASSAESLFLEAQKHNMANNNLSSKLGMNYSNLNNNYLETDLVGIGSYYVSGGVRHHNNSLGPTGHGLISRQVSESGNSTNSGGGSLNNAKLIFNQQQLSRAWDVSQRSTG